MTQEKQHDIVLMRYSVISPIINGLPEEYSSLDVFYRDAAKKGTVSPDCDYCIRMHFLNNCCFDRRNTEFLFRKRNRNDLLFLENCILPFCDLTCLGPQAAYMIIKLAWMDRMLFTPGFIPKATGTTLMDYTQPFFIRTARMFFKVNSKAQ